MKDRLTQLADLLDIEDHDAVVEEIRIIASLVFPRFDYGPFDRAYGDIVRLFRGDYPGYRCSNVDYHDLSHTLSVTLAMTRLMHGAIESGCPLTEKEFDVGLICGLMHDTGYIQRSGDTEGTGAKYTLVHINRSVEFIVEYYRNDPLFQEELPFFDSILQCTGLNTRVGEIQFQSKNIRCLGQMLGTADLLGQMADRHYLEKLLDLYYEFVEAGITAYSSQLDLLEKTRGFFQMTRKRFSDELGDVYLYGRHHFRKRWNIDENLYMSSIEKNLNYLDYLVTHRRDEYRLHLRRTLNKRMQA
ncbi:MAG TPA: hypothetical protein PLO63_05105 [Syntrophales bacterium]|nr:hypothetical protein [Syntrophales bacterium]